MKFFLFNLSVVILVLLTVKSYSLQWREFHLGFQAAVKLFLNPTYCKFPHPKFEKCGDLPKKPMPNIPEFVLQGRYEYNYVLDPDFDCMDVTFTYPDRSTNLNGGIVLKEGSRLTTFTMSYSADGMYVNAVKSTNNRHQKWYCQDSQFDNATGSFFAVYVCNGDELEEFVTASNNKTYLDREMAAVMMALHVKNGDRIHSAKSCLCDYPFNVLRFSTSQQAQKLVADTLPLGENLKSLVSKTEQ